MAASRLWGVADADNCRRRGKMLAVAGGHHPRMGSGRDAGRSPDGMDAIGKGAAMITKDAESFDCGVSRG